jgi:glycine/D-amino acid oxidase-like deaminating enzyme
VVAKAGGSTTWLDAVVDSKEVDILSAVLIDVDEAHVIIGTKEEAEALADWAVEMLDVFLADGFPLAPELETKGAITFAPQQNGSHILLAGLRGQFLLALVSGPDTAATLRPGSASPMTRSTGSSRRLTALSPFIRTLWTGLSSVASVRLDSVVQRRPHARPIRGGLDMKDSYRVVIIGGGVVGASVLYHLAKFGWTDVCLLERSVLTAGSSWHAAGGFHALNADPNMAALQAYTIDLLSEIQEESGQDIGLHMTGGLTMAGTPDRWEWLQSAYRVFQSIGIDDCRLVTPEEAGELNPIMSTEGFLGGMWADREGYLDTTGTVHAYAKAAKKRGASFFEHTKVESLEQTKDGWKVVTDKGTITCEHVVNAAGLWAKQVGRMAGIELPVSPMKHHYLISDTIPKLEEIDFEVPMTVDLEGFTYLRQDQKGVLLGIYEVNTEHWAMDGAPWDYGMELFQEQTDRIEHELTLGFERYPDLQHVGVKTWVNGAFTFSPDGNPLVGPVPGKRGYWSACAVMAGFLQGGGVGKTLAEWMIHGEPEADAWSMDVARYGPGPRTASTSARRRAVLFPPLRDDLPQRAASGGPPAEARAGLFRDDGGGVPVGPVLGPRGAALFRRQGVRGDAVAETLQRP